MGKGGQAPSEMELELAAAIGSSVPVEKSGYIRVSASPRRQPGAARTFEGNGTVPAVADPTAHNPQQPPNSMSVIEPVESPTGVVMAEHQPGDLGEKCVGILKRLFQTYGFLEVKGIPGDIYFKAEFCGGLYAALRVNDDVHCYVKNGRQGPWAYRIYRV